jgi:RNA polymerase sigma factor (sigma-70 family)
MQTATTPRLPFPHQPRSSASRDIEDADLIRRIAAHEAEAFTTLYQRYAPRLGGFLSHRLAQPDLVDDVLHETLMVVWQDAARFRGQAQLSTWIFGIAQRKALQAREACQRGSALPVSLAGTVPEDSEGLLLQREHGHAVTRALAALAPAQRTILDLSYVQDWSVPAIAMHLGCSVSTVKTRLRQARRGLAARLAHAERSLTRQEQKGTTRALTRPRPRCAGDHSLRVTATTTTFDGVATNGMTHGRQEHRLCHNVAVVRPYLIKRGSRDARQIQSNSRRQHDETRTKERNGRTVRRRCAAVQRIRACECGDARLYIDMGVLLRKESSRC